MRIVLQVLLTFLTFIKKFQAEQQVPPEKEQVAPERRASGSRKRASGEMKASKWLQPSAQREGFKLARSLTLVLVQVPIGNYYPMPIPPPPNSNLLSKWRSRATESYREMLI